MKYSNFHLISDKNNYIAFHYPTSEIILLNEITYNILDSIKNNIPILDISNKYNISQSTLDNFIHLLEDIEKNKINTKPNDDIDKKSIDRITLHVSNDCNLRCKYCYANGGNYNQNRHLMTKETANKFIEFCTQNFNKVNSIVFFGGEPLINIEIMEYICKQFNLYYSNKAIDYIPKFDIITNGTILNDKVVDFIKNNISTITISIDGKKEINDINRIDRNGRGSFEKISNFIHTVKSKTNTRIIYEATYTKDHIANNYTRKDIITDLQKEFAINGMIIEEESIEYTFTFEQIIHTNYENLIESNFKNLPNDFWAILHSIVYKEEIEMCPIAKKIFAINTDGIIYSCHLLNGIEKCSLGSIFEENIFNNPSNYSPFYSIQHLKDNKDCRNCWAQKLCGGCTIKKFYDKKTNTFNMLPNKEFCKKAEKLLEQIILLITHIRKDRKLWTALLEYEKSL